MFSETLSETFRHPRSAYDWSAGKWVHVEGESRRIHDPRLLHCVGFSVLRVFCGVVKWLPLGLCESNVISHHHQTDQILDLASSSCSNSQIGSKGQEDCLMGNSIRVSDGMNQVINKPLLEERTWSRIEATLVWNLSPLCCWSGRLRMLHTMIWKGFWLWHSVSVSWDVPVPFWVKVSFYLTVTCLFVALQ